MPFQREHHWNLYDAVAGRIRRDPIDTTFARQDGGIRPPIAPDEMLLKFRYINSVPFDENKDLPNGNLLSALHWYTSSKIRQRDGDESTGFKMYDETVLIALGILVEEIIKDALGPNGHLVWAQDQGYAEHESSDHSDEGELADDEHSEMAGAAGKGTADENADEMDQ